MFSLLRQPFGAASGDAVALLFVEAAAQPPTGEDAMYLLGAAAVPSLGAAAVPSLGAATIMSPTLALVFAEAVAMPCGVAQPSADTLPASALPCVAADTLSTAGSGAGCCTQLLTGLVCGLDAGCSCDVDNSCTA